MEYKEYSYSGPVEAFGRCIANNWKAKTTATSEGRARSNLIFRYKKEHGYAPTASIKLPGKIKVLEQEEVT